MSKKFTQKEASTLIGKIFFNKYKIIKIISFGAFGCVFQGIFLESKEQIAIKIEKKTNINYLESECHFLLSLNGPGIPQVKSFGVSGHYFILVLELLGKSLYMILHETKKPFTLKDVCMIAIQSINRLEFVHSKYIIHRDIKPQNFLIGYKDPFTIYLIDFGLSRKYRSSQTKRHLPYSKCKTMTGTAEFISHNVMNGICSTRRDDLESLGLILIYLKNASFPWDSNINMNNLQKFYYIIQKRRETTLEQWCKNLPKQFFDYLNYCRNLHFQEDPNYEYLKNLFKSVMEENNFLNDLKFSWIKEKEYKKMNLKELSKEKIEKTPREPKRKESRTQRLFKRIQNSFSNDKILQKAVKETKSVAAESYNPFIKNKYSSGFLNLNNKENKENMQEVFKHDDTTKKVNINDITGNNDNISKKILNTEGKEFNKEKKIKYIIPLKNDNHNNNLYNNNKDEIEFNDLNYKKVNNTCFNKNNSCVNFEKEIKKSPEVTKYENNCKYKLKKYSCPRKPNKKIIINESNNYNNFNLNLTENRGYCNIGGASNCNMTELMNKNSMQKNENKINLKYNKKILELNCTNNANNNYSNKYNCYNNNYLFSYNKLKNSPSSTTIDLTIDPNNSNQINQKKNFPIRALNSTSKVNVDQFFYDKINTENKKIYNNVLNNKNQFKMLNLNNNPAKLYKKQISLEGNEYNAYQFSNFN